MPDQARTPEETVFVLSDFFPYKVRIFYTAVSGAVRQVYMSLHGLSVNEWRTLAVLNGHDPLSAKEIVARSSMDKVNVSRAISALQKKGILERHIDPTDRRRVLLRLTRKGRRILMELLPEVKRVEDRMLDGLSPEERETFLRLMARVTANARAIGPPIRGEHH
ncbi:MAG: MarR family winged helix-turn-helix transcriptional regulator [Rhodospirillum sp.]|nr:MarR family winged helix-turn-helix transcriptional regulator [Rhodospirillum sp.]MCF8491255.1 MarR family winged helix-turn-helix transcriptional regulator [Rhodospirillum sp.]MCF8500769.1 MarR family winged helix-turn-helix transcriptional regulator [Rhodospirillum sp.]